MSASHPKELPSTAGYQRPGEAHQNLPGVAAAGSGPAGGSQDLAAGGGWGESGALHLVTGGWARPQGAAWAPPEQLTSAQPSISFPFLGLSAFRLGCFSPNLRSQRLAGGLVYPLESKGLYSWHGLSGHLGTCTDTGRRKGMSPILGDWIGSCGQDQASGTRGY